MILHDFLPSGNGYKIRLTCAKLGLYYQLKEYDITQGDTRTEAFLALSPNGKIPVLELDDGHCLSESNSILLYLAEAHQSDLLPNDPLDKAEVTKWLFWEQYSHEPNIASVRFWLTHNAMTELKEKMLPERIQQGHAALTLMDDQLSKQDFLAGNRLTLADICLFAYTHVAEEGGAYQLSDYPNVQRWIQDIQAQNWFIPITHRQ
ncbi:glutathione S-transferase family protein [Marinomonas posidonica]|uniref:Glutathione S-transferase domain protein n=1 Tax=Marinomonas posidonica (strain CECT 7376 / NCIMB 14433 / IVIA-Po-181) TaxID=491952 RepID=F6CSJ9_MARPP|nr:glutathione S-transferase family protein [Marinomonas posidonica]AEF56157.1 Glutathione S-transferase domain protein [Marinomonas posidonica IVIA-Po-181]